MRVKLMAVKTFDATFTTHIPPLGTPARAGWLATSCRDAGRARPGRMHESYAPGGCLHRDGYWHRVSDRARYRDGAYDVPALCGRRLSVSARPADELYVVKGFVLDVPGVDGAGICTRCEAAWRALCGSDR
jgi:hypothetical protein